MSLSEPTDAALLRAAEPRAFGELYARHSQAVYDWFARRVAWAAADLTRGDVARAWLAAAGSRTTATARCSRGCSVSAATCCASPPATTASRPPRASASASRWRWSRTRATRRSTSSSTAAVAAGGAEELPPHERAALELRVVEELSYDDVARSLRIRPAAARLRESRALRRLSSVKEDL